MSTPYRLTAFLITVIVSSGVMFGPAVAGPDQTCDADDAEPAVCRACIWKLENCRQCVSKLEQKNDTSRNCRFKLAQALTNLAVVVGPSKERREIHKKKNRLYENLLNNFPNDSEIIKAYALSRDDDVIKVRLLKRLVSLTPDDYGAHWILGQILTDSTDDAKIREGLLHYADAYEFAEERWKVSMGTEYILALREHGYQDRAAQFFEQMLGDYEVEELFSRASELLASDKLNPPTFPNALTELTDIVCHVQFLLVDRSRCESVFRLAVRLQQMFPNNTALASLLVSAYERIISVTSTTPDIDETSIRRAYALAVQDDPDNLYLLRAYGSHLDTSRREEILSQHIDTYLSTPAASHAELAELYWGNSQREYAIQHMYRAFRHDEAPNRGQYGERLSMMLREVGRIVEANSVESQVQPNQSEAQ